MNHNILGDGMQKKSKYDSSLADRLNKEVEDEIRKEDIQKAKERGTIQNNSPATSNSKFKHSNNRYNNMFFGDGLAAPSSSSLTSKNQDEWIEYWNNTPDGYVLASAPVYYHKFKELYSLLTADNDETREEVFNKVWDSTNLLSCLRSDFQHGLITSTRITRHYKNHDDDTLTITHNYNCPNKSLIENIILPKFPLGVSGLEELVSNKLRLLFLQAYFDTTDDADTIKRILAFVSEKNACDINVRTTADAFRYSEYPGVFIIKDSFFYIGSFDQSFTSNVSRCVKYF